MTTLPLIWMLTLGMTLPTAAVAGADASALVAEGQPVEQPQPHSVVWISASGEDAGAAGTHQLMRLHKLGEDEDDDDVVAVAQAGNIQAGGPWLGIQFGPVSKPLASQLRIESGVGQMVLNVAEGSPADTAGFQQYDVITQIDGQNMPSKIGEFLEKVRSFNPNETHTFSLVRAGQPIQTVLTIGARPDDVASTKYKYEMPMEELAEGKVFGRGGMLEKDDQGNWVFKGFNMKDLPDVFHAMPDVGDSDFQFNIALPGPGGQQVYVYKDKGETLKVIREKDGKITVTRTDKEDGKSDSTTTTYDNEEDLKARDAAAYEAMKNCPAMLDLTGGFPRGLGLFGPGLTGKDGKQWEAIKQHEKALKRMHGDWSGGVFHAGKARTSFETTPDGRVRVTIRQGEEEFIENYDNANALKTAKPDLYRKYEKFQRKAASKDAAR